MATERRAIPTKAAPPGTPRPADATSGQETYGGGRYLWIDPPDAQDRVVLDFNLAFNPPCAWTPYATCPLPTRDNRLDIAVEAGEKAPQR